MPGYSFGIIWIKNWEVRVIRWFPGAPPSKRPQKVKVLREIPAALMMEWEDTPTDRRPSSSCIIPELSLLCSTWVPASGRRWASKAGKGLWKRTAEDLWLKTTTVTCRMVSSSLHAGVAGQVSHQVLQVPQVCFLCSVSLCLQCRRTEKVPPPPLSSDLNLCASHFVFAAFKVTEAGNAVTSFRVLCLLSVFVAVTPL